MGIDDIVVRSHVARDFLQSAGLFKNDKLVVWEYVSNGLQYTEPGITPEVYVTLDSKAKEIVIEDNGRGMDRAGLRNFFLMHGENLDRKAGRRGRGRFGTGKSAAFGIANRLQVSSVKNGTRNTVQLTRTDIEKGGQDQVPVRVIETNVAVDAPNGTVIRISEVSLRRLDQQGVMKFIERHLAHWANRPLVFVNSHPCEYIEPPVDREFRVKPAGDAASQLGDVALLLKVAKTPLDQEQQGIAIFSSGVWLETTLAGVEGQAMSQYIFGEIDVPALDDESSSIPAYDMSRSMQLNPNNELVMTLLAFIGQEVDRVRRDLAKEDQERRAQHEAKRLAREASQIAAMINQDFLEFSDRVARVRAKSGKGRDPGQVATSGSQVPEGEELMPGENIPADLVENAGGAGQGDGQAGDGGDVPPDRAVTLVPAEGGKATGDPTGTGEKAQKPRGGFRVDFKEMGQEEPRAKYVRGERAIFINLDHPQIAAARGKRAVDDPSFRRLAYEVAFAEYAIALASELAARGEYIEPSDPIFDIRETLNRMARRAAALYLA